MKTLLLALLLAARAFAADETVTHRITGLFAPSREADLRGVIGQMPGIKLTAIDFDRAEATFSYDPAVVFKGTKPDEIVKRIDEKIRAASHSTFGVQPVITTPREQFTRIEIPVIGLDCAACCLAAYEAICKIDGVAQATVSFKEGRITALIDPAKTSRAALEAALEKKQVKIKTP